MNTRSIKLPDIFIEKLLNLPENGMGYHVVKVILRNGKVLHWLKVINSEYLILESNQNIHVNEIENVDLE